jgi:hypothetical protein
MKEAQDYRKTTDYTVIVCLGLVCGGIIMSSENASSSDQE